MSRTVALQVRQAYGLERIYPMNETAKLLCSLTNKKTLSQNEVYLIKALGFEIEWLPLTLELKQGEGK